MERPGGEAGVKIAEATPAPRDGEASRGVGGDRRERRPSNLTSSLRDGPTTGGRGRDAPDAWKTSRAGAASSGASMALAALGKKGDASYSEIKEAMQCDDGEVEEWVVRAVGAGVVDAKMDQMKQRVFSLDAPTAYSLVPSGKS